MNSNPHLLSRDTASGKYELDFWGSCENTFHEEQKQLVYAKRMGLVAQWQGAHPPWFDLGGRSVIDIGGGPVSLLLKCINRGLAVVIDPGEYPWWVRVRYQECGIEWWQHPAEKLVNIVTSFEEAWIYNVLTHTDDPEKIIFNARKCVNIIRIFEWLEMSPREGHPQILHAEELDTWLGGRGFTTSVNENGAVGLAYYGVFAE